MRNIITISLVIFCTIIYSGNAFGQKTNEASLSENAPTDKPHNLKGAVKLEQYEKLIAPYVHKAQKTLPKAKKKYSKGLKDGQAFFLTTRIYDKEGNFEQIFVRVKEWDKTTVSGTIANQLNVVKGFTNGQLIEFPETAILDWLITNPDGTEEGNFVGKYLDTLR